jgi:polyhydroxyalkanoate synthase subunit PhaC
MTKAAFDALLDMQKAAVEDSFKTWQRLFALPKVSRHALRVRVGITPHDVVYEEDSLKLLRYRSDAVRYREPVLICYALVNRPYILDLQPERSVVGQLLRRGFDVYLIDWGVPTAADRTLRLDDYISGLMRPVVEFIRERSGSPVLNLLGYCMGGTMSTMFTALYPELIRSLILMAAPIDFSGDDSLLHVWTQEKYFDVDKLIDACGNCPAPLLQGAFQVMKPVANYIDKYLSFWENLDDDHYLENFFAMERWGQDNIPVAGETFREFVKCLYQRNQLVKGEFRLGDRPVKLERITCPLLLLAAEHDHLVPPASTFGLEPHVRSPDVKKMAIHAGHVGLAVSSKAHRQFWPEATQWIAEHSTATQPGAGDRRP